MNVGVPYAVGLTAALLVLLCLPGMVALMILADDLIPRRPAAWRDRRVLRDLDRALAGSTLPDAIRQVEARRPSIEQIAADLRRLDRQRAGVAAQSRLWYAAVLRAYDDRLRLASRCLGVVEHLDGLTGMDLEIERVRVEGELQAAGLDLRGSGGGARQRRQGMR